MGWSEERVALLRKLWAEGLSASQIAKQLGGVTRNAVIGKVHRLGLAGRATTSRMKTHRARPRMAQAAQANGATAAATAKRQQKPTNRFATVGNPALRALYQPEAEPFVPSMEELDIPLKERKTIQTLGECHCRWPIGDPQHADFHFCGKEKVAGLPYCQFHARRAFQPPQTRRRDPADVRIPSVAALVSSNGDGGDNIDA